MARAKSRRRLRRAASIGAQAAQVHQGGRRLPGMDVSPPLGLGGFGLAPRSGRPRRAATRLGQARRQALAAGVILAAHGVERRGAAGGIWRRRCARPRPARVVVVDDLVDVGQGVLVVVAGARQAHVNRAARQDLLRLRGPRRAPRLFPPARRAARRGQSACCRPTTSHSRG